MNKKIKLLPVLVALVSSTSDVSFNLKRNDSLTGNTAYYEQSFDLDNYYLSPLKTIYPYKYFQ